MSLRRAWVISCDQPGCSASIVFERSQDEDHRATYGESANDAGWDAAPGRRETYCPAHAKFEPWWDDDQESALCEKGASPA